MAAPSPSPEQSAKSVASPSIADEECIGDVHTAFKSDISLENIRGIMQEFAQEFHTPRNLCLALTGEVGELAECFQWKGEVAPGLPEFSTDDKVHLSEELSDVLLYTVRLADRCGIDLSMAVQRKLERNAMKYPKDRVRGSAKKYTEYRDLHRSKQANDR